MFHKHCRKDGGHTWKRNGESPAGIRSRGWDIHAISAYLCTVFLGWPDTTAIQYLLRPQLKVVKFGITSISDELRPSVIRKSGPFDRHTIRLAAKIHRRD